MMGNLLNSITGPRLFSVLNSSGLQITNYSSNFLEYIPNYSISVVKFCIGVFKWTALFWIPFVYKRYKSLDGILSMGKLMGILVAGYWALFVIRGFGRFMNPMYTDFLLVLEKAQKITSAENMELLNHYYFDFSHWPVNYDVNSHPSDRTHIINTKPSSHILFVLKPFCYILAHTIGIRMAFPGCTSLINILVANQRIERLIQMTKSHKIKRVKLRTADLDDVEAFYKDNRDSKDANGKILVISCEGNAGYAEIGNPKIPLEKGYSVIGWNHPGFGGSTGLPFPKAEHNAIDAVMRFAIDYLQFDLAQIVLFGWSIGGYTATWAAMNYPEIRGLILDATFDNIDKLAEKSMPMLLYPLVLATVHEYLDLDVGNHMTMYDGPVRFIIRGQDEIITVEQSDKKSNRGLFLLVDVLKKRYPDLITETTLKVLWTYLGSSTYDAGIILDQTVDPIVCEDILRKSVQAAGGGPRPSYPLLLPNNMTDLEKTKLLLYIVSKYRDEFNGTHCTELAASYFKEGWSEYDLRE